MASAHVQATAARPESALGQLKDAETGLVQRSAFDRSAAERPEASRSSDARERRSTRRGVEARASASRFAGTAVSTFG